MTDKIRVHVYMRNGEVHEIVVDRDEQGGPLLPIRDGMVRFGRTEYQEHLNHGPAQPVYRWMMDLPQAEIVSISR